MSYSLWAPRDKLTTDSITGSLALEVEMLRERLQRQTDIAVRAEAALNQLAMSTKASQAASTSQMEELRSQFALSQKQQTEAREEVRHNACCYTCRVCGTTYQPGEFSHSASLAQLNHPPGLAFFCPRSMSACVQSVRP